MSTNSRLNYCEPGSLVLLKHLLTVLSSVAPSGTLYYSVCDIYVYVCVLEMYRVCVFVCMFGVCVCIWGEFVYGVFGWACVCVCLVCVYITEKKITDGLASPPSLSCLHV